MSGFRCMNRSTADLVAFARSSLPHQTNRRPVLPPAVPLPPHAAASAPAVASTTTTISARENRETRPVIAPLLPAGKRFPLLKRFKDRRVGPVIGSTLLP